MIICSLMCDDCNLVLLSGNRAFMLYRRSDSPVQPSDHLWGNEQRGQCAVHQEGCGRCAEVDNNNHADFENLFCHWLVEVLWKRTSEYCVRSLSMILWLLVFEPLVHSCREPSVGHSGLFAHMIWAYFVHLYFQHTRI